MVIRGSRSDGVWGFVGARLAESHKPGERDEAVGLGLGW